MPNLHKLLVALPMVYKDHRDIDVLPVYPGTEDFTSDIVLKHDGDEVWGGVAWSRPLNAHTSIGIGNFMAVSYTYSLLSIDLNALTSDMHVVSLDRVRQYDYLNLGMIWKFGLAMKYPNFTALFYPKLRHKSHSCRKEENHRN